jgi:hypothetical protein
VIPLEQMTDEQFERHALGIIHRELGVYGLARFLRVYGPELGITRATAISGSRGLRFRSWLRNSKATRSRSIHKEYSNQFRWNA